MDAVEISGDTEDFWQEFHSLREQQRFRERHGAGRVTRKDGPDTGPRPQDPLPLGSIEDELD